MLPLVYDKFLVPICANGGTFSNSKIQNVSNQVRRVSKPSESLEPCSSCGTPLEASAWLYTSCPADSERGGINPRPLEITNLSWFSSCRSETFTPSQDSTRLPKASGSSTKSSITDNDVKDGWKESSSSSFQRLPYAKS